MPSKEAIQRSRANYNAKVDIVTLRVDAKINQMFVDYCKNQKMTKKDLFEKAVQYYIDNH